MIQASRAYNVAKNWRGTQRWMSNIGDTVQLSTFRIWAS